MRNRNKDSTGALAFEVILLFAKTKLITVIVSDQLSCLSTFSTLLQSRVFPAGTIVSCLTAWWGWEAANQPFIAEGKWGCRGVADLAVPWLVPSPGGSFAAPPVLQSCAHPSVCHRQRSQCCVLPKQWLCSPVLWKLTKKQQVCVCARSQLLSRAVPPACCSWQAAQFMVLTLAVFG